MKNSGYLIIILHVVFLSKGLSQDAPAAATKFLQLLDSSQQSRTLYPFDGAERYVYHYFPVEGRKGIALEELTELQRSAALDLMKTCLSEQAIQQVHQIIELEVVLKALEQRKPDDHFRDPGKYYFTIFGVPSAKAIWGWRLEGHHVYFNFSSDANHLVSGTPGFLGANPAVVQQGPNQGEEVLKLEREQGFALLHAFSIEKQQKAIIDSKSPEDIVTATNRKAMIEHPTGVRYTEMTASEQSQFLQLISFYVHRFTKLFADNMLNEIQQAGLDNLWFAWAGHTEPGIGNPHYYRIQGPTIIIEYDNTQNNGNHVHTVVRDLLHDFGGDELLEHYKVSH
jgi:hypothetical protein